MQRKIPKECEIITSIHIEWPLDDFLSVNNKIE